MIDCHVHVFDPQRFPYRPDTFYAPAGPELGTPDWPFLRMPERIDYGPLVSLLAEQVPDDDDRRRILWDTPAREFGFTT